MAQRTLQVVWAYFTLLATDDVHASLSGLNAVSWIFSKWQAADLSVLWDEVVVCIVLGSHQIWEITIQSTVFLTATKRRQQDNSDSNGVHWFIKFSFDPGQPLCVFTCKLSNQLRGMRRRDSSFRRRILGILILIFKPLVRGRVVGAAALAGGPRLPHWPALTGGSWDVPRPVLRCNTSS